MSTDLAQMDLAAIPVEWANPPDRYVSKLPRERKDGSKFFLDYMGHADITLALIAIDPAYGYGWLCENGHRSDAVDEHGNRIGDRMRVDLDADDNYVVEGFLLVHGVERLGIGSVPRVKYKRGNTEVGPGDIRKELVGDLLRNCAMRFGLATGLWSKSDSHETATVVESASEAVAVSGLGEAVMAAIRQLQGAERDTFKEWVVGQGRKFPVQPRTLFTDTEWTAAVAEHLGIAPEADSG